MSKSLQDVQWKNAAGQVQTFKSHAFVKETLQKLGKTFDANGKPESSGLSNIEHVKLMERGMHEIGSQFGDQNEPTPEERTARAQLIGVIGVNTSQSRQTFEACDLLKEAGGERKRGLSAVALLD